jgi:hypothetical protein
MKVTRNTERIIEVLDLLNNEQRPSTINSYIIYVISSSREASLKDIIELTQVEFDINLEQSEVSDAVNQLIKDGQLVLLGEKYKLTEAANEAHAKRIEASEQQEEKLRQRFYEKASSLSETKLADEELQKIFKEFKGYIHENFFYYGKSAIAILGKNNSENASLTTQQLFKLSSDKLPPKLKKVFYAYIENLTENSSALELEYYESLADRAEHFFALGLSKELAQELASFQEIDWKVFVDTNFLLSALKIRENTMNPAVDSLMRIIDDNKEYFKIKLTYLRSTYKELMQFKPVLNGRVLAQKLTENQIKAALQSGNLDTFTEAYYKLQLAHPQGAQHPSVILDQAALILRSKKIEIHNGNIKGVDPESESFTDLISDYSKYYALMNEARIEKQQLGEVRYKDTPQIEHDVELRESILCERNKNGVTATHFQDCKIFGLTLDFGLIAYDKYAGRRDNGNELFIPAFFTPTYLLKKLYKLLPVQSDDYRKAFLSSIASPVFSGSQAKSEVSQSALAVFNAIGIDDLSFMTKSLTSSIFLDEIKKIGGDVEKATVFIESQISKELKQKGQKEARLAKELKDKQDILTKTASEYNSTLQDNSALNDKKTLLEQQVEALTKGLKATKKAQDRLQAMLVKAASSPQQQIPFGNEQDKLEIERLKEIVRQKEETEARLAQQKLDEQRKIEKEQKDADKEAFVLNAVKKWQWDSVKHLLIALAVLIILALYSLSRYDWNYTALIAAMRGINKNPDLAFTIPPFLTLILFIFNLFLVQKFYSRHYNHSNIKAFRELLPIPKHLK